MATTTTTTARFAPAHFSLKWRMLGFVLVCILVAATALGVNAYRGALRDADAMFDLHLQQMAHSLRGGVPLGLGFDDGDREGYDHRQPNHVSNRESHSKNPDSSTAGI